MIMDYVEIRPPRLVESGVKYFLNETLKQCHIFKERFHNWIFNIGLFLLFLTKSNNRILGKNKIIFYILSFYHCN